jgi:hypothetical protein
VALPNFLAIEIHRSSRKTQKKQRKKDKDEVLLSPQLFNKESSLNPITPYFFAF